MIGALKGIPQIMGPNEILIMVNGVGYKVIVSAKLMEKITNAEEVFLYTYTHVAEDALELFGFLSREESETFKLMLSVSGIGPKTAVLIMEKSDQEIRQAVLNSDVEFFTSIPRIGKKNAQKIIIELKSKIGSLVDLDLTGKADSKTSELIEALTAMGFKRSEVLSVLRNLSPDLVTTEERVKAALKMLGR